MDPVAILALVSKGLSIAETIWENRDLALSAINSVKHIVENHKTMTPAEIATIEVNLDSMLDEFNSDLPPETQL
jgi:hypothetical protein